MTRNTSPLTIVGHGIHDMTLFTQHISKLHRVRSLSGTYICRGINECLDLWNSYNTQIEKSLSKINANNLLRLSFEELVQDPVSQVFSGPIKKKQKLILKEHGY